MTDLTRFVARATIGLSEMTLEQAIQIINARHAKTPLAPEDVFIFRGVLSSQALDSYMTRMGISSLQNFAADFTEGRALMNSHRAGGFASEAELPIGRIFAANVVGSPLPNDAPANAGPGASLMIHAYIQRGLNITEISTDEVIKGIEGGTVNDMSVGFQMGIGSMLSCSVCGKEMRDYPACEHFPGESYDGKLAYAWIENARGVEGSLVYKGATPGAMIEKAIRMVEDGRVTQAQAERVGEVLGVRFYKAPTAQGRGVTMDWDKFLAGLQAVDPALKDRLAGMGEGERLDAINAAYRDMQARVEAMRPQAEMGQRWIADLVDQAVKERVRAEVDKFDAEKYRRVLLASSDPEYIKEEIASWKRAVAAIMKDGKRPTATAGKATATPAINTQYK